MPTSPTRDARSPSASYDVLLDALTLMEDKIMRAISGLAQRLDALDGGRQPPIATATTTAGEGRNANAATKKRAAAHDIGATRDAKQLRNVPARAYAEPDTSSPSSSSESEKSTNASDEDDHDDDVMVVVLPEKTTSATTTVATVTPTPSAKEGLPSSTSSKGKKKQTTNATGRPKSTSSKSKVDLEKVLTHDEQHLIETGRGRRGEALETPLGWCYFTRNNETAHDVGRKIGVEPLVIVSLNRWTLKLKVHDHLVEGTRLWIQPQEEWEFEYIAEDRTKVLKQLYRRIQEVFPDFVKSSEPLRSIKEDKLASYPSSGKFYDEILQTLAAAELQARSEKDDEKFTDVQTIRERFGEKWVEVGFLPPSAIVNRTMNMN